MTITTLGAGKATPQPPFNPLDMYTNLISYWPLDEASGTRSDAYGSNHLTDNNTVGQAAGKVGNAADFIAANLEYLNRADNALLSMGDIDFTLACWVWVNSLPGTSMGIVTKWQGSLEYMIYYRGFTQNFAFIVNNGGYGECNPAGPTTANTWHFVVAWHDSVANTVNLQIDNGAITSNPWSNGVTDGTDYFGIGNYSAGQWLGGRVDELGLWKRVLTAAERDYLWNGGAGRAYPFV